MTGKVEIGVGMADTASATPANGEKVQLLESYSSVAPNAVSLPTLLAWVGPIMGLILVLYLAGMPAWLVIQERWLAEPTVTSFLDDAWCENTFLCNLGLPKYFAGVLFFTMAALVIVLLRKDKQLFAAIIPGIETTHNTGDVRQSDLFRGLFVVSALVFGIAIFITINEKYVPGWWFLLGLGFYLAAWITRDGILPRWQAWIWENLDFLAACGLAHMTWVLFLADLNTWEPKNWVYALGLALAMINLLRYARRVPVIFWIFNLSLFLLTYRVNSWAYSVIGDDLMFFMRASEIAETGHLWKIGGHLFDGILVYGAHPYFSTILQVISMKLLGIGNFAWRFSSLYLAALSLPLFLGFFRRFLPKAIAYLAVLLLGCSSYLMTFGKIGYNNLQALFGMALVLWAAGRLIEDHRLLSAVGLGLAMGFCMYVYPAALYALPLPLLLLAMYDPPFNRASLARWGVTLLTFFLLLLPLLFQPDYWQAKGPGLISNNPEITQTQIGIFAHISRNLFLSLFSYLYILNESHFIAASYVDPLSAVLLVIGLGVAIKEARHNRFLVFWLVSFVILIFLVGVSHDREFPPSTRMFLMLPSFLLFAALGLYWLVERLKALPFIPSSRNLLYSTLLLAALGLNLYQAYPLSERRSLGQQNIEVLFIRVAENIDHFEATSEFPRTILFLTDQNWGIDGFRLLQKVYGFPSSRINLQRAILTDATLPANQSELIAARNTLVIVQPSLPDDWKAALGEALSAVNKAPCEVKEASNKDTRFVLWYSPDLERVCPGKTGN